MKKEKERRDRGQKRKGEGPGKKGAEGKTSVKVTYM